YNNRRGPWGISGNTPYAFKFGDVIPANGYALVVGISPDVFRTKHNIPASVPVFGPYLGTLDNDGGSIVLQTAQDPELAVIFDRVDYDDQLPWPPEGDDGGGSLERLHADRYGNDPLNWAITEVLG